MAPLDVVALPSMQRSRVRSINFYKADLEEAAEGQSVIISLEDEIDVSRGDMIVRRHNIPEVEPQHNRPAAPRPQRRPGLLPRRPPGSQGPVPQAAEIVIDTDAEDPGAAMEAVHRNLGIAKK